MQGVEQMLAKSVAEEAAEKAKERVGIAQSIAMSQEKHFAKNLCGDRFLVNDESAFLF